MLRKRICSPIYFLQDYFLYKTKVNMIIIGLIKTLYKVDFNFVFNKAKKISKKDLDFSYKGIGRRKIFL